MRFGEIWRDTTDDEVLMFVGGEWFYIVREGTHRGIVEDDRTGSIVWRTDASPASRYREQAKKWERVDGR